MIEHEVLTKTHGKRSHMIVSYRIAWPPVVLRLRLKNLGRGLNVKQSLGFQCGTDPTGIPIRYLFDRVQEWGPQIVMLPSGKLT